MAGMPSRPGDRVAYFIDQLKAKIGAHGPDIRSEGDGFRLGA
jgi:hypothetical protein